MTTTTITAKQLQDAINAYTSSNANPIAVWRSLSGSGDQYASAAYEGLAVDNSPKKEVITAANKINGLTDQQFNELTNNTAIGYLALLKSTQPNPDGTINLPNTTQIETNYYNACIQSGVRPSGAIDLSFEKLGVQWYSENSPVFVELDPARFGPPSPEVDNISYVAAVIQTAATTVSVAARILQNGVSEEFDAMRNALDNIFSSPSSQAILDSAASKGISISQSGITYQNSMGGMTSLNLDNNAISIQNNKNADTSQNFLTTFQFDTSGDIEYKEKDFNDGNSVVYTPNGDGSFSSVTYDSSDQNQGTIGDTPNSLQTFVYTGNSLLPISSDSINEAFAQEGPVSATVSIANLPDDFTGSVSTSSTDANSPYIYSASLSELGEAYNKGPFNGQGFISFDNGNISDWSIGTPNQPQYLYVSTAKTGDIISYNSYAGISNFPGTWMAT